MSEDSGKKKIRDLITAHMSGPSPTCEERQISDDKEWGLLKTTAVVWEGWNAEAHKVPPKMFWGKSSIEVQKGDVIVTKAGPRGRVGVVAFVDETPPRLMVSGKMIGLRPDRSKIDGRYLAAILSSDECQRYLDERTTGMAESQLNFSNNLLLELTVSTIDLKHQKKIAAILETVDEAIEGTQALIGKYEQVKAGMMQDLFTRGLTPDGKLRPPRETAPDLYQNTPIGWIPKDWEIKALEQLTTKIVDGIHHKPEYAAEGIPFITVKNLTKSRSIEFSNINYVSIQTHEHCTLRAHVAVGDLLVTKDGTLGVARIVEDWMPEFSIFVSVALLKPTKPVTTAWLHFFFESGAYLRQLSGLSAGSGLQHIHLEHFRKFLIPLPYEGEQEEISDLMKATTNNIASEELTLQKLRQQKSGLMADLLTGKVPVSV